jgi:hypothetical protein
MEYLHGLIKILGMRYSLHGKNGPASIFRHIRDIPYSLAVPMTDLKTAPG